MSKIYAKFKIETNYTVVIMKTKILMLIVVLGAMVSLSSCGCYVGFFADICDTMPFGYQCGKISRTKVRVASGSWIWQDLEIYRRGMIVEVYRGSRMIRRYDMRYEDQQIDERFNATNLYGQAVSVRIEINGFNRVNVVYCYCGTLEEHWFLT